MTSCTRKATEGNQVYDLDFFCAAHRFLTAATIRARPSADRCRFLRTVFADRPCPQSMAFACCKASISASIEAMIFSRSKLAPSSAVHSMYLKRKADSWGCRLSPPHQRNRG